ncbi:hypothetical protein HK405_003970, partial [Cladochytrium tenue]
MMMALPPLAASLTASDDGASATGASGTASTPTATAGVTALPTSSTSPPTAAGKSGESAPPPPTSSAASPSVHALLVDRAVELADVLADAPAGVAEAVADLAFLARAAVEEIDQLVIAYATLQRAKDDSDADARALQNVAASGRRTTQSALETTTRLEAELMARAADSEGLQRQMRVLQRERDDLERRLASDHATWERTKAEWAAEERRLRDAIREQRLQAKDSPRSPTISTPANGESVFFSTKSRPAPAAGTAVDFDADDGDAWAEVARLRADLAERDAQLRALAMTASESAAGAGEVTERLQALLEETEVLRHECAELATQNEQLMEENEACQALLRERSLGDGVGVLLEADELRSGATRPPEGDDGLPPLPPLPPSQAPHSQPSLHAHAPVSPVAAAPAVADLPYKARRASTRLGSMDLSLRLGDELQAGGVGGRSSASALASLPEEGDGNAGEQRGLEAQVQALTQYLQLILTRVQVDERLEAALRRQQQQRGVTGGGGDGAAAADAVVAGLLDGRLRLLTAEVAASGTDGGANADTRALLGGAMVAEPRASHDDDYDEVVQRPLPPLPALAATSASAAEPQSPQSPQSPAVGGTGRRTASEGGGGVVSGLLRRLSSTFTSLLPGGGGSGAASANAGEGAAEASEAPAAAAEVPSAAAPTMLALEA